jgi:hypothetical protein
MLHAVSHSSEHHLKIKTRQMPSILYDVNMAVRSVGVFIVRFFIMRCMHVHTTTAAIRKSYQILKEVAIEDTQDDDY